MSFAVIHMKKIKEQEVKGMQIHNQREKESHSNLDIDKTRSLLNYDLLNDSPIDSKALRLLKIPQGSFIAFKTSTLTLIKTP